MVIICVHCLAPVVRVCVFINQHTMTLIRDSIRNKLTKFICSFFKCMKLRRRRETSAIVVLCGGGADPRAKSISFRFVPQALVWNISKHNTFCGGHCEFDRVPRCFCEISWIYTSHRFFVRLLSTAGQEKIIKIATGLKNAAAQDPQGS